MRTVVFGDRDLGVSGLEALLEAGFEVVRVYAWEEAPGASGYCASVRAWGQVRGLECARPADVDGPELEAELRALRPEIIFVLDYPARLGPGLIAVPARGALRLHPSLLPAFDGPAPVVRALIEGARITGVTLHYLLAGPGLGDEVGRAETYVRKDDDALSLGRRLAGLGRGLLAEALPLIKSGSEPRRRLEPDPNPAGPIDPRIDWRGSSWRAYNKIRALVRPNSGARCGFMGNEMIVWRAEPDDDLPALIHPGELQVEEGRAWVGTSFGGVRLEEIEWRGKLLKGVEIARELEPLWREKFE